MKDDTLTITLAKDKVRQFVNDRESIAFHTPKNLSMDITIETSELMEIFMWETSEDSSRL